MRQMQLEKGRLELEQMRNPPADPRYQQVSGADLGMTGPDAQRMFNVGPDGKVTAIGGGGTNVSTTVNTGDPLDTRPIVASPDKGYQRRWDPEAGTWRDEPIPGSDAAQEIATNSEKAEERDRQRRIKMGTTLTNLQMNIQEIENGGWPVTGPIGAMSGMVPGTAAADWRVRNAQITTEGALAEVQNMRNNNPTGGGVGQLTDSEREAIAIAATGISNAQSAEEYVRAAKNYRKVMLDTAFGAGAWSFDEDGNLIVYGASPSPGGGPPTPTPGQAMTFEQFRQDPSAQAAAEQYGVTLEEMWEIKQGLGR